MKFWALLPSYPLKLIIQSSTRIMKHSGYLKKTALLWLKTSLLSQQLLCIASSYGSWWGQRIYVGTIPDHKKIYETCASRVTWLSSSQINYFCHPNSLCSLKWTCTFLNFLSYIVGLSYNELLNNCCVPHVREIIISLIPSVSTLTGAHSDLIHTCL